MIMEPKENKERILECAREWIVTNSKDQYKADICLALIEKYYSDKYENKPTVSGRNGDTESRKSLIKWSGTPGRLWDMLLDDDELDNT